METRLGWDFSSVRVHDGPDAQELSGRLMARAFTYRNQVFFNRNQYHPTTEGGRQLLMHELGHVVEQTATAHHRDTRSMTGPPLHPFIQRAEFRVGSRTITIDYGNIYSIPAANHASTIESMFVAYTGSPDASPISAAVAALSTDDQRRLLYALDVLIDNTRSPEHNRLNRVTAVRRLIAGVNSLPSSPTASGTDFESDALRIAGWYEVALPPGTAPPSAADIAFIGQQVNPPPSGAPPGAPLDAARFRARLRPALIHYVQATDPGVPASIGTHNLGTLQGIADILMREARSFFSPYADTSRATVFGLTPPFHISSNVFSVTTAPVTQRLRLSLLSNRADLVGFNSRAGDPRFNDRNIYRETHYDGRRAADRAEKRAVLLSVLGNAALRNIVDRKIRSTGRQTGTGAATRIGLATEFDASATTPCRARWRVIETLTHEILHALTHPDFTRKANTLSFARVLREGFTEVLSTEFFNRRVRNKAILDPAFRAQMTSGIAGVCSPHTAIMGYGAAGHAAADILNRPSISMDDYKAAYFLGRTDLVGLP